MRLVDRGIIATDNVNTYACYIYPDAEATGNSNGGIDWTQEAGLNIHIGFEVQDGYFYDIPGSGTEGIAGIDGVRECFSCFFCVTVNKY